MRLIGKRFHGYRRKKVREAWELRSDTTSPSDSTCRKEWNCLYLCRLSRALDSAGIPALAACLLGRTRLQLQTEYNADVWHGSLPSGTVRRGPFGLRPWCVLRSAIPLFRNHIMPPRPVWGERRLRAGRHARPPAWHTYPRQPIARLGKKVSSSTSGFRVNQLYIELRFHVRQHVPYYRT